MPDSPPSSKAPVRSERVPPYSEEAERGVLGSILLDGGRVMDLCIELQIVPESFHVPAHRHIYEAMTAIAREAGAIDVLTVADRLQTAGLLDALGGTTALDTLIDATPTAAHAEYYIGIVRQKYLFRRVIDTARYAEVQCHDTEEDADVVLGRVEQAFLDIAEHQHGYATPWSVAVKQTMEKIEDVLMSRGGLRGISTGFVNLDGKVLGLKPGEMTILAARPSMGKTSLAMNIAENVVLGRGAKDHKPRPVGMFSLEMAYETLVMRMLCAHAGVSAFKLSQGYTGNKGDHKRLIQAASVLTRAPLYVDDAAGLDVLDLRARARRMKKKFEIELIVVDYLQLLNAKEYSRQGRQIETAAISGQLKAAAKELNIPVLVLSQLSRAPEQRSDKKAKPKLSDLRDSGAIEQDADVVWMLRRPSRNDADEEFEDKTLAYVDVAKNRNGPTGEVQLNFEEEFTRFTDRSHGVDGLDRLEPAEDEDAAEEGFEE